MLETDKIFHPVSGFLLSELKNSTLIIPSISIGNIPQLANDLLIHTLKFQKIGSLDDTYLYPFASPVDTSETEELGSGISSAVEVYYNKDLNKIIIQQRSPIINGTTTAYVNEVILPFIKESKFAKVLILDSSDAGLVEDLIPGTIDTYTNEDLLNKSLESLNIAQADTISLTNTAYKHSNYIRTLIGSLDSAMKSESSELDVNVLVSYVYEGDNFNDGEALSNKVLEVLKLKPIERWIRPKSWLGVYGDRPIPNAMEDGLFG